MSILSPTNSQSPFNHSLATIVSQHSSISYLGNILTPEIIDRLNTSSRLTLFLPVDDAWKALDPVERLYLESKYATDDLHRIVDMHAVADGPVVWSDSFEDGLNCECPIISGACVK